MYWTKKHQSLKDSTVHLSVLMCLLGHGGQQVWEERGKTNTWPPCLWPWEFYLGSWHHLKSCVIKSYAIITHKNSGWKSSLSREHSSPCLSWHTMAVAYFARAMVDHNHILLNILLQRWRLLPGLILMRALVSCYCRLQRPVKASESPYMIKAHSIHWIVWLNCWVYNMPWFYLPERPGIFPIGKDPFGKEDSIPKCPTVNSTLQC